MFSKFTLPHISSISSLIFNGFSKFTYFGLTFVSFFSTFFKFSSLCFCLFSRPEIYLLSRFRLLTYLLSFFWFPVLLHYLSSSLGNIFRSSCILSFVFPLLFFRFSLLLCFRNVCILFWSSPILITLFSYLISLYLFVNSFSTQPLI